MPLRDMPLRDQIFAVIQEVAQEQGLILSPLSGSLGLFESGLDSLGLAIIVMRLEDLFGVDPFEAAEYETFPTTIGDFVRLYESAFPGSAS